MNLKPLLFFPPLAAAALGFMWMTQPGADAVAVTAERKQAVRAITVATEPVVLSATGYGRVEAVHSWSAVSQAEGRVVDTAADLAVGTVLDAGALLVQIDPTDYELAISKAEANIAAAEATLSERARQEENTRRLLDVEQRILNVAQDEFDRIERLSLNGTTTAATLDTAQKALLNQENAVINLTNTLALFPAQRASSEATLLVRQAELAEAKRALENTTIRAPFRGRVAQKAVENGQFVRVGAELIVLEGIDQAEVVGAFQPQDFAALIRTAFGNRFESMAEVDATRVISYLQTSGVTAYVVADSVGMPSRYPVELTRFRGSIDADTGTLGIAVRLDDPLVALTASQRPPLEFGSFVSVVLEGTPPGGAIAIPRRVLQQDDAGQPFVYTADAQDRLAISPVTPGSVAGDRILITQGLTDGARVLLSTPRPTIPGLPLEVILVDGPAQ